MFQVNLPHSQHIPRLLMAIDDVDTPTSMVRVIVSPTDYFLVCFTQTDEKRPAQWAYDEIYHCHTPLDGASHTTNCAHMIPMFKASGMFHVLRAMFDDAIEKAWRP